MLVSVLLDAGSDGLGPEVLPSVIVEYAPALAGFVAQRVELHGVELHPAVFEAQIGGLLRESRVVTEPFAYMWEI